MPSTAYQREYIYKEPTSESEPLTCSLRVRLPIYRHLPSRLGISPRAHAGRLAEAFKRHVRRQLEDIEALGDDYQDQGLIFPGEKGQPMRPWTLTGKLERILQSVGLPHIRFHDLAAGTVDSGKPLQTLPGDKAASTTITLIT